MKAIGKCGVLGFAGLMALASLGTGAAQAGEIKSRIPFPFSVGKTTLPAGTYEISTHHNTLSVRSATQEVTLVCNSTSADGEGSPRLVFEKYGDQYFLRQAWLDAYRGRELPRSSAEREQRAAMGRSNGPERVVVAVR